MPSIETFRMMPDEDLLLHGKEAKTYSNEFVVVLVERFEELLGQHEALDHAARNLRAENAALKDDVYDLRAEIRNIHA